MVEVIDAGSLNWTFWSKSGRDVQYGLCGCVCERTSLRRGTVAFSAEWLERVVHPAGRDALKIWGSARK